ncbi:MAG: fumarylacetoacetate hydrolase family protein, partial [Desulfobulbia bacterium]
MKLVTIDISGELRIGALIDDENFVDLNRVNNEIPTDLSEFVRGGTSVLEMARIVLSSGDFSPSPLADVTLKAPFPRPLRNIMCVGKNYYDHANEFGGSGYDASSNQLIPDHPPIFTKTSTTVIGDGESIPAYLDPTNTVDYEGELTVIIGTGGRGIKREDAYDHVFGYTIVNDVTARDLQQRHKQWFIGKNIDGFCPMGPCVVTADEIGDITTCVLQTKVNGELRQNAVVKDLIFDIPYLIECLSEGMTLEAGDLIATGTPAGVGIGFEPSVFLKSGDVVEISV